MRFRRKGEIHTIEVEHEENGRNNIGNKGDEEVGNTLSEKKMPK